MSNATLRIAGDESRSLPRRIAFTSPILTIAGCPPGRDRTWLYDSRQAGLCLMVTVAGGKAFYVYRKVNGRPQRVRLGSFPDITIEQARKLAAKTLGEIAGGADPMQAKREARAKGMNIGELWTWYLDNWAKPRKRSWTADKSRYETWVKPWAARRLTDIKRAGVAQLHQRVSTKTSSTTANRVLALLSTMFNQARTIGWEKGNPCQGVSKFAEQSRERFLSAEELQRFMTALEAEPVQAWKDVFKLCLFTGARRSNVMSTRWEELDLAAGRWTIPAAKFKNGQASTVHLSPQAVQILTDRKNESEWVFPSNTSKTDHLVNPAKRWDALCKRAKLADLHIHDLRRTLGSWQAAGGSSLQVIGKSLGHKSLAATAVYSRLDLDPVKVSVNAATAAMMAAAAKKPADEPEERSTIRTGNR